MISQFSTLMDRHTTNSEGLDTTAAMAAQFRLAEKADGISLAEEITENQGMPTALLKAKVLTGRQTQVELTARLRDLRASGNDDTLLSELADSRRLYHISTVLARAELLVRSEPSLSQYSGDEAKFDDITILERVIGFLKVELKTVSDTAERSTLTAALKGFHTAEGRVENADY